MAARTLLGTIASGVLSVWQTWARAFQELSVDGYVMYNRAMEIASLTSYLDTSVDIHGMRFSRPSFFFFFGSLLFGLTVFAQKPDYSGTWVLNLQKSQLQHQEADFTGSRFIIQQKGDQFKLTRYHYYGEKRKGISFKMKADGKTRTIKLLFKGRLEWTGEQLKATLSRKNFLNIVDYHFGQDSNEFVADETFTGLPRDHHNIWVFDREISSDAKTGSSKASGSS